MAGNRPPGSGKGETVKSRPVSALLTALLLTAATTAGCASTDGETCDGGSSPSTVDEAVRGLIAAAEAGEPDRACQVVSNTATDDEMTEALTDLRKQLAQLGVDAASAKIVEGEQGGSLIPVEIRSPESSAAPIEIGVLSIREEGYRVLFPEI